MCNLLTEDCLRVGISRSLSIPVDRVIILREHAPAGQLRAGEVVGAAYVDNGNIVGAGRQATHRALAGFLRELDRRRLAYHEVVWPSTEFVSGGVQFLFGPGVARPRPGRCWRLYAALSYLLQMKHAC